MSVPFLPSRDEPASALKSRWRDPSFAHRAPGPALALLCAAAVALWGAQAYLARQQQASALADDGLAAALQARSQVDLAARRAAAVRSFLQEASRMDLVAGAWDERRFGIRQASMTREAANRLLAEIARSRGRVFAAESFDISVKDPREGLFTPPDQPRTEVVVSLRGSLLARAGASTP